MNSLKIVAAIPCLNAQCSIGDVVAKARGHVNQIIVIDDGSQDATARIARTAGASVVSHDETRGYGESIKSCFEEARKNKADILVILDSDGQHNPDEIPRLLAPILNKEADLVIGSRFLQQNQSLSQQSTVISSPPQVLTQRSQLSTHDSRPSTANSELPTANRQLSVMPRYRRFGISAITRLVNIGSKVKVTDAQSGFRAYSRRALNSLSVTEKGMGVSVEVIIKARQKGLTIKEVPISCSYHAGSSMMNPLLHGLGVAFTVVKWRFNTMWHRTAAKREESPIASQTTLETASINGVSIVIPAYNAEHTIRECLECATSLKWAGELEVIVVNDVSSDNTSHIASSFPGVKVIDVPHGGAARATNIGIKAAHHDMVVLLDADAMLEKDWLEKIITSFDDPAVAAVGGYAVTANRSIIGKIMGYDVESRLDKVPVDTDHLSTMNTACRREALLKVGPLNEALKVGYDVDLSRKLKAAGYRLILRKDATCRHYWKDDFRGYLHQQYNYAYYRMELARRFTKPYDQLTGLGMVLQVPLTIALLLASGLGSLASPLALLLLLLLPSIHLPQTFTLLRRRKDTCVLLLPLLFTIRNLCWVGAAIAWGIRRVTHIRISQAEPVHNVADNTLKDSPPESS